MASPVTAGVAALLLEYYPTLTPQQIKTILEKSSVTPPIKATIPGTSDEVSFTELSRTGGLVNAYEAAKLAAEMTSNQKPQPKPAPSKTKIKVKKSKKS